MNSTRLQQTQKQSQTLKPSPQLQTALKVLQVPAPELRTVILEELQANPLLEEFALNDVSIDDNGDVQDTDNPDQDEEVNFDNDDFSILENMAKDLQDRYGAEDPEVLHHPEGEKNYEYLMASLTGSVSLQQHLIDQAETADSSPEEHQALLYLIGSLDDNGFLTEPIGAIAAKLNLPTETVEKAVAQLKSFDPAGIGAKNLQDCLITQLELNEPGDTIAVRIIRDHFDLLARKRIPELAGKLKITVKAVHEAIQEIARLNPRPAQRFKADTNVTIEPDVTIYQDEHGQWQVDLNNDYVPSLRISNAYKEMLAKGTLDEKERAFVIERMRSGKFLINSIEQRQQTIQRIAKEILRLQKGFFESGVKKLQPMTMDEVAQIIEVHETTVSRAVANKYVRTPHGVFPFKYFFTTGYISEDGELLSNKAIKDRIKSIIEDEPESRPFSDQAIAEMLAQDTIKIARRTVAKYREELGILPTHLRRRY